MRMWMFDVKKLCDRHLLAEHVELHMIVGSLRKKKSLSGYVTSNAIEPKSIKSRHKTIVSEMTRRGWKHTSLLPTYSIKYLPKEVREAVVNKRKAYQLYKTKKHTNFGG